MKIAVLGILGPKPIKKDALGGTELFTFDLVTELIRKGHDVTLFSMKDSVVNAKLNGFLSSDFFKVKDKFVQRRAGVMHNSLFADFLKVNQEFDLVHISTVEWYYFLPYIEFLKIPHIITVHSKILADNDLRFLGQKYPEANYILISKNFMREFPALKNKFLVYNGITLAHFNQNPKDYIFWLGRMIEYKGTKEAIKIAESSNQRLLFGGPGIDSEYYKREIKPRLLKTKKIKFLGELNFAEKNEYFQNAKLFLNPIKWEEPFGLVMIEAMACGTPVVAFGRGSVLEIIKDGKTGFVCPPNDLNCMVKAVKKIYEMPAGQYQMMRRACRELVEKNFTVEKMVEGYEKVYAKIIANWKRDNG